MKQHQEKFGARRPGEDRRKYDQFIRKGESDKGQQQFNDEQKDWFHSLYDKHLGKYNLGYKFSQKPANAVNSFEHKNQSVA
jgi:hypothetical protein